MDAHAFIWNNWWIYHAIWNLHTSPLHTSMIFAPFGVDLRMHTLGLLNGLLSMPFVPLLGTVGVLNLQVFVTPMLNGWTMSRLATRLSSNPGAGALAGGLIAATPAINFHLAVGRPSLAAVWPVLLSIEYLLRAAEEPSRRNVAGFTAALVATIVADQQMTLFGLTWLVLLIAYLAAARRIRSAAALLPAVLIAGFVSWYLLGPVTTSSGYTVPAQFEAARYSYPVSMLWTPSMIWRVYGAVMPCALVAAFVIAWNDRRMWPWLAGTILCIALSFGPSRFGLAPFDLFRDLPGTDQFRTPYRFQMPAAIGLATLAALALSFVCARLPAHARRAALVAVAVFAAADLAAYRLRFGFDVQSMPYEPVYAALAKDPRNITVLEVPFGVRTGTDEIGKGEVFTFYQPVHGKRIINGFAARGPLEALQYYRSSAAIRLLAGLDEPNPGAAAVADLKSKLSELDVGYVVVHKDRLEPAWRDAAIALVREAGGLEPIDTGRAATVAFRRSKASRIESASETVFVRR